MTKSLPWAALLLAAFTVIAAGGPVEPHIKPAAAPFDAADVRLLDGPFKQAQDADAAYLLTIETDRLLARFRADAGLQPKAEGYGGWEADTIGGHTLGHYLSACARMFAATGDVRFKERVAQIVGELAECQVKNGDGYVAAIPGGKKVFAEVTKGDIRTKGFDLNGLWVPWYTLHKEMAGLRDCYIYCGNEQALAVMKGLGDFSLKVTDGLDAQKLNLMLRCEHGGMNEVAADLYGFTGEAKYQELARRFNDHQVLDPLSQRKDILPGLHSNTQIPKIIGAARQSELWGDDAMGTAASFFWKAITEHHSYATGGNSLNEYLGPEDLIGARLDGNTTETCNTYNMLRLTRKLYSWSGDPRYMEYYERAVFNHILSSQDPRNGAVCYFVPLRPGSNKPFQGLHDSFTCCVGTGMENHAAYGDVIYSHTSDAIIVNLFIPSRVNWKARGIELTQQTMLPDSDSVQLVVGSKAPTALTLRIRSPQWLAGPMEVQVNGTAIDDPYISGGYIEIRRTWNDGDRVNLHLPMQLRAEPTPDDSTKVALMYGPVVLAGDLGNAPPTPMDVPCLVTDGIDVKTWAERVPGAELAFQTQAISKPKDVRLIPFFRVRDQFYNVYWNQLTTSQWGEQLARIQEMDAKRRKLEAITSDFVQPGEMQPERDHAFEGDRTNAGEHMGVRWRDAYRGSWFSFKMKLPEQGPARLLCTYWGSDFGDREFDIVVDDVKVASQVLDRHKPGEFFDVAYDLPAELTKGKTHIRVKFQAHPQKTAGGVFGCRIVRAE